MTIKDVLIYFSYLYEGDYNLMLKAIKEKERINMELFKSIDFSVQTITILDSNYPECLKNLSRPPLVLFYKGDINLLSHHEKLSVVGTRKPTTYGKRVTEKILNDLLKEKDIVIVSGLAKGIDSIAHNCALNNNRKTIAVLAQGIDEYYINSNNELFENIKKNGLIISEYPNNVKIKKENFLSRNRLIAALSKNLFIPEAFQKSGTSITLNYALELGRNIMCVPKNIDCDSLCNLSIKQGAKLILDYNDILEEL